MHSDGSVFFLMCLLQGTAIATQYGYKMLHALEVRLDWTHAVGAGTDTIVVVYIIVTIIMTLF